MTVFLGGSFWGDGVSAEEGSPSDGLLRGFLQPRNSRRVRPDLSPNFAFNAAPRWVSSQRSSLVKSMLQVKQSNFFFLSGQFLLGQTKVCAPWVCLKTCKGFRQETRDKGQGTRDKGLSDFLILDVQIPRFLILDVQILTTWKTFCPFQSSFAADAVEIASRVVFPEAEAASSPLVVGGKSYWTCLIHWKTWQV